MDRKTTTLYHKYSSRLSLATFEELQTDASILHQRNRREERSAEKRMDFSAANFFFFLSKSAFYI